MVNDESLWQNLVKTHLSLSQHLKEFFSNQVDRITILREAFERGEIATALYAISYMESEEIYKIFDKILYMSTAHGYAGTIRKIILSLPRDWVLQNIENVAEPFLIDATEDEYRRFLELYINLDKGLASRLVKRAIAHPDLDIQEAGRDFQNVITKLD